MCGRTAERVDVILDQIRGRVTESHLYKHLGDKIELIDVSVPLSTLMTIAAVSGRVFRAITEPTNATVDPDLVAGDIWIDTDAYYPGTTINQAYRYSGTAWVALPADSLDQLSAAILSETVVRADADSIEASKREGLYAGAFAGVGNAYNYFIQLAQPTATRIGDIWAWLNPEDDVAAIFKRWDGVAWRVITPEDNPTNSNADAQRRAAAFKGVVAVLPAVDNATYVIGDQVLFRPDPATANSNKLYVYTARVAPNTWSEASPTTNALASAMVYQEQYVRADDVGNARAYSEQLVAAVGRSLPNLCPNALFEDGIAAVEGATGFTVDTGVYGVRANRASAPAGTVTLSFPKFPISAGLKYGFTGDARISVPSGTGSVFFALSFYAAETDSFSSPIATTNGPARSFDEFSDAKERREAFWFNGTAPAGANWASLRFRYTTTNGATRVSLRQPTVVLYTDGDSAPPFTYDSSSAVVADVAQARIGYCTKRVTSPVGPWQTTADATKQACEAAHADSGTHTYLWNTGLPWADAIKQVYVVTTAKCYRNGVLTSDPAYDTQGECEAGGGYWVPGATAALEQRFQALQENDGVLSAQYSVKVDVAGHVSGFGLSTEWPINGSPSSQFGVRADRFFVTGPSITGTSLPTGTYDGQVFYNTDTKQTFYYWTDTRPHPLSRTSSNRRGCTYAVGWKESTTAYAGTPIDTGTTCISLSGRQFASVPFIVQASTIPAHCSDPTYLTKTTCEAAGKDWFLQVPRGAYIETAYIQSAVIDGATIRDATIDSAKILSLSADKITAGSISVGNDIKSANYVAGTTGWIIEGNGDAEFGTIHLRNNAVSSMAYLPNTETPLPDKTLPGVGLWVALGTYTAGTVVYVTTKSNTYICTTAHTGRATAPGNASENSFWASATYTAGAATAMWSSTTSYAYNEKVWYAPNAATPFRVYVCVTAHTNVVPGTNTSRWRELTHFQELVRINDVALGTVSSGLGAVFSTRFIVDVIDSQDPTDRAGDGDVQLYLLRINTSTGALFKFAEETLMAPFVGRNSPGGPYRYRLHYASSEYVGSTAGSFLLFARSNSGLVSVSPTIGSIGFGYTGMKR